MKKKILSIVLTVAMAVSMTFGVNLTHASASGTDIVSVGTWTDLLTAVAGAKTDGTQTIVNVTADLTAISNCAIDSSKNILIQESGGAYKITRDTSLTGMSIFNIASATLTLKNITLDGNAANFTASSPVVWVGIGGTVFTMDSGATIQNAKVNYSHGGAGANVSPGAVMNMLNGSSIHDLENVASFNAGYYPAGALRIDGTLNMYSGSSITNCKSVTDTTSGVGAIALNGTLTMNGGAVTNNSGVCGGVYDIGTLNLSGSPSISGNTEADGSTPCNVYLFSSVVLTADASLSPVTPIGITTKTAPTASTPQNVTSAANSTDLSGCFISDNANDVIQNSGSGSTQVVQLALRSTVIDVGDSSGTNLPTGVTYAGNLFTIGTGANNSTITVQGTTTSNTIAVSTGVTGLTLILNGVSITSPSGGKTPADIQGTASVVIQLANGTTSTLDASGASNYKAGLCVPWNASAVISGSTGVLNATGSWGGAGIGGSGASGGTITIGGGHITAAGGGGAAGIGGGNPGGAQSIIISGGVITATAIGGGAGIGSGNTGICTSITISGGTIAATGVYTGIGSYGTSPGIINISGSPVIMAASEDDSLFKPAVNVGSISSGKIINAKLSAALSSSATTYLKCNGNVLSLPANYLNFAIFASADSAISAYSDSGCTTLLGNIVTDPAGLASIPVTDLSVSPANVTPVNLVSAYTASVTVNMDGSAWITGTPTIELSASSASLTNAVSGTLASGVYSFASLDPAKTYYVWNAVSNQYLNKTVSQTSQNATVDYYTVTLTKGTGITSITGTGIDSSGSGIFLSGSNVSTWVTVSPGYTWSKWTQTIGGADVSTTQNYMIPSISTTIAYTANAVLTPTFALTVNLNGGNGSTASGSYASGATVSIDAGTRSGYTFNGWTSSNGGTFADASSAATTFTMPGNAATITASWAQIGVPAAQPPANNNTIVIVDGTDYSIGTENKNGSSTVATVDQGKLTDDIAKASDGSSTIFPISSNASITAQLVVKNVEDMAQKDMTLTVQTGGVSYNLTTTAIDTAGIRSALGTTDTQNIPFNVSISNSNAVVNGATVVVSPVEFTITATYNGNTVSVDNFSSFVNRTVEITGEQAKQVTTAVVVQPDGSLRHVPTKVTEIDGKYYAVISSLTNSIYTVIQHPVAFSDVTASWAKDSINDMGSRMVVQGIGDNKYAPDRDITRAEFAAIVVRALGLAPGMGTGSFSDVKANDWYCGYIQTASLYGIVTGYSTTTFGPLDKITREQAMTMIARAMKITGLAPTLTDSQITSLLSKYADASAVSDYASAGVAACIDTGVILGRPNHTVASKDFITRAEVAVIVDRMLQKSGLI